MKGQINLKLNLYSPIPVGEEGLALEEKELYTYPLCSPLLHFANSAFSSCFLIPLKDVDFSCFQKLNELKQYLIDDQKLISVSSSSQIRIWHGQKLLKKDHFSLKKLSVGDGSSLTIQVIIS